MSLEAIAHVIREKKRFVLSAHYNPDGDAVGSVLGLADMLDHLGREALCFFEEPVPVIYRFLPGSGRVVSDIGVVQGFLRTAGDEGAVITLDCGDRSRVGRYENELLAWHPVLVVDHHHSNLGFGDVNWISPDSAATGEMIFELAQELGLAISPEAAQCLYAAISTDTGSFHYASTSSHTFEVAAALVRAGADPANMANQLYNNFTPGRLRLLHDVLATLKLYHRERIAVIRVTRAMRDRTFTTLEDVEHFVNYPRAIRSVRVAVFLKETEPGHISVSLRAKGQCDVSRIAAHFGGGGHKNASGCTFRDASLDEVHGRILPLIVEGIRAHEAE